MQRFRGGLILKAHRLSYHSTLGLRVKQKKRREGDGIRECWESSSRCGASENPKEVPKNVKGPFFEFEHERSFDPRIIIDKDQNSSAGNRCEHGHRHPVDFEACGTTRRHTEMRFGHQGRGHGESVSERGGNTLRRFKCFYLNAKARIWP